MIIILLIIAGGVYSYSKIQSSLFPQITFPKIKIIAEAGQQPVSQMTVAVTPVSYTHLDVYKRQAWVLASKSVARFVKFRAWSSNTILQTAFIVSNFLKRPEALFRHKAVSFFKKNLPSTSPQNQVALLPELSFIYKKLTHEKINGNSYFGFGNKQHLSLIHI